MNNNLREQIHNVMDLKDTDELLDIWETNNREEWSDDAFDVIKSILIKRGEKLPEQGDPVYEVEKEDEVLDEGLEDWEAKALNNEDQPEFYNVVDVILLRKHIDKTAKALIIIYALSGLMAVPYFVSLGSSFFPGQTGFTLLIYIIAFIVAIVSTAITIAIVYFPLKALTHILRILMEMEFRSRKTG